MSSRIAAVDAGHALDAVELAVGIGMDEVRRLFLLLAAFFLVFLLGHPQRGDGALLVVAVQPKPERAVHVPGARLPHAVKDAEIGIEVGAVRLHRLLVVDVGGGIAEGGPRPVVLFSAPS
jgi:hypothetical protein